MTEHPILFSAPMVRAILAGRKTQTRRVIKPQPILVDDRTWTWPCDGVGSKSSWASGWKPYPDGMDRFCPYGQATKQLWVKETCWFDPRYKPSVCYRADGEMPEHMTGARWTPSRFMPRWASRLLLEITEVRVQRVQDISEEDAQAEGCDGDCPIGYIPAYQEGPYSYHYAQVWHSLNAKRGYGWDLNPWVWAISFRRIEP